MSATIQSGHEHESGTGAAVSVKRRRLVADGRNVAQTKNQRIDDLILAKQDGDVAFLIGALSGEERGIAAMFLGRMGASESTPQLMRLLSAADPGTRSSAVKALMRLDAHDALPDLVRMVRTDGSPIVRSHAMGAVRRLGQPALVVPVLLKALHDRDGGASASAAENLGMVADATAIEPIRAAAKKARLLRRWVFTSAIRQIRKRAKHAPPVATR